MGSIPDEPWLWLLAIIAGTLVVLVALWLGGVVEVGLKPPSLKFRRRNEGANERLRVLNGAHVEDARIGDIAGVKGASDASSRRDVEVGRGLKIKGGSAGDIAGVIHAPPPHKAESGDSEGRS